MNKHSYFTKKKTYFELVTLHTVTHISHFTFINFTFLNLQVKWIDDSLQLFGIKENIMKFEGKINRDINHMYVYKDKLHK